MAQPVELGDALADTKRRIGLPPEHRFDLGVLFVHGVGEQTRGDTLTEAGDAMVDWLRREYEPAGEVTVLDVALRQPSEDSLAAAHAVVRIRADKTRPEEQKQWVLAEAWWAEVFRPATFAELAGWGVVFGPWVFVTQAQAIWQRAEVPADLPMPWRLALLPIVWLIVGASLLLAAAAGLAATVLALGLLGLALLPIPVIPDLARNAQRTLGMGVGDAYVLTRSPIRFSAMTSEVRSDLHALRQHATNVGVMAHSQGAAVAWAALKREALEPPPVLKPGEQASQAKQAPIRLFITYGQALRKLTFLLMLARRTVPTTDGQAAAVAAVLFVIVAIIEAAIGMPHPIVFLGALALAMLSEFSLLFAARRLNDKAHSEIRKDWLNVQAKAPEMRWLDLWASADVVPNGPLRIEQVHSYKIRNVGSPVDHVVYWRNPSEFITIVASQTGPLGGLGEPSGAGGLDAPRLVVAAMRRHARVMLLVWARIVVFAAALAAAVVAWETTSVGQSVIDVMGRIPLINELVKAPAADWLVRGIGVGAALAAGGLFWVVCGGAWGRLAGLDDETYFTAASRHLWQPAIWIAVPAVCVAMPVVATLALWSLNHHTAAWVYALSMVLLVPLALTVLSGGGVTLGHKGATHTLRESARRIVPRAVVGNLIVAGLTGILVAAPIVVLVITRTWDIVPLEAGLIGLVLAVEGVRRYLAFAQLFACELKDMPTTDTVGQSASSFERAP
jgi:hypothetical protein